MGDSSDQQDASVQFILIGTALALMGGFFSGLANILVKWVSVTTGPKLEKYRRFVWFLVIFSYVGNGLCDFSAFAFAPLSVVAPISALTIATNAGLAYIFFREKLTKMDALGSFLVIAGSAIATSVGSRQSAERTLDELNALWARPEWIIFASFEIISMFVLIVMTRYLGPTWPGFILWIHSIIKRSEKTTEISQISSKSITPSEPSISQREVTSPKNPVTLALPQHRSDSLSNVRSVTIIPASPSTLPPTRNSMIQLSVRSHASILSQYDHDKLRHQIRAVCYAFLASYLANWTNVLGKITAEIVSSSIRGHNAFIRPESYFIIAGVIFFAVMQLKCMTEMMAIFEAVLIIPIYQCVFMITLIICGAVFFDEFNTMTSRNIAIFCSAIVICCVGVYVLSQRAPPQLGAKPMKVDVIPSIQDEVITIDSPIGPELKNVVASPISSIDESEEMDINPITTHPHILTDSTSPIIMKSQHPITTSLDLNIPNETPVMDVISPSNYNAYTTPSSETRRFENESRQDGVDIIDVV